MSNSTFSKAFTLNRIQQILSPLDLIYKEFSIKSASSSWLQEFNFDQNVSIPKIFFTIFPRFSKEWRKKLNYSLEILQDIKIIDHGDGPNIKKVGLSWEYNPWKYGYNTRSGVVPTVVYVSKSKTLERELHKTIQLLKQKIKIAKIGNWENCTTNENFRLTPNVNVIFDVQGEITWVNTIDSPKHKDDTSSRILASLHNITDTYGKSAISKHHNSQPNPFFENVHYNPFLHDLLSNLIQDTKTSPKQPTGLDTSFFKEKDIRTFLNNNIKFFRKGLKSHKKIETTTFSFHSKRNKILFLKCSGQLFVNSINKCSLYINIQDITEAATKENSYQEQLKKSKKQIKQLLNFAYMVSLKLKSYTINFSLLFNVLNIVEEEKMVAIY